MKTTRFPFMAAILLLATLFNFSCITDLLNDQEVAEYCMISLNPGYACYRISDNCMPTKSECKATRGYYNIYNRDDCKDDYYRKPDIYDEDCDLGSFQNQSVFGDLMVQPSDLSEGASWSEANSICGSSTVYDHNDWRLPSIDELGVIYSNKNSISYLYGADYWSSSEKMNEIPPSHFYMNMRNGDGANYAGYSSTLRARCVRTVNASP